MKFLLRADDHVETAEDPLQLGRDRLRFDEAVLAVAVARQAPEVGPVVDVEDGLRAGREGQIDGAESRGLGPGMRHVRAGGEDAAGLGDELRVDIVGRERHVGAVLAVEDQREAFLIADTEQDERREALRVGDDTAHVHPFGPQLLADKAPHVLVADAGDHGRFQAEPCRTGRRVGGRAADVLAEGPHVLQPAAHLAAVEVDRRSADGYDIERTHHTVPPRDPSSAASS